MDAFVGFVGDTTMSYGISMRNYGYRDYERFPYGVFENDQNLSIRDYYSKTQEKCQKGKKEKNGKQSCPFCLEQRKRPLVAYLRKRELSMHDEKIFEEKESDLDKEQDIKSESKGVASNLSTINKTH